MADGREVLQELLETNRALAESNKALMLLVQKLADAPHVASVGTQAQSVPSPDDEMRIRLESMRRDRNRPPSEVLIVKDCKSEGGLQLDDGTIHAATFDARIVVTSKGPRVVELQNYRMPDGFDRHPTEGGFAPSGAIYTPDMPGQWSTPFKVWVWNTFGLPDRKRYIGRPLPAHFGTPVAEVVSQVQEA
jgi:hypothetical protein